jgi:hypothetical protein
MAYRVIFTRYFGKEKYSCEESEKIFTRYNGMHFGHPDFWIGEIYRRKDGSFFFFEQADKVRSIKPLTDEEARFILKLCVSKVRFEEIFENRAPPPVRKKRIKKEEDDE